MTLEEPVRERVWRRDDGAELTLLVRWDYDHEASGSWTIDEIRGGRLTNRIRGIGTFLVACEIADRYGVSFSRGGETFDGPLADTFGPGDLRCEKHPAGAWLGTVRCGGCRRVWRLADEHEPGEQPGPEHGRGCVCGAILTETARAICETCYRQARAS